MVTKRKINLEIDNSTPVKLLCSVNRVIGDMSLDLNHLTTGQQMSLIPHIAHTIVKGYCHTKLKPTVIDIQDLVRAMVVIHKANLANDNATYSLAYPIDVITKQ